RGALRAGPGVMDRVRHRRRPRLARLHPGRRKTRMWDLPPRVAGDPQRVSREIWRPLSGM
ncbi:hypothetical protein, partial [Streptodolium elevatio]